MKPETRNQKPESNPNDEIRSFVIRASSLIRHSGFVILGFLSSVFICPASEANEPLPTADGYSGIWYKVPGKGEIKYSGGMATYPQQIRPFAIYRKEVN